MSDQPKDSQGPYVAFDELENGMATFTNWKVKGPGVLTGRMNSIAAESDEKYLNTAFTAGKEEAREELEAMRKKADGLEIERNAYKARMECIEEYDKRRPKLADDMVALRKKADGLERAMEEIVKWNGEEAMFVAGKALAEYRKEGK